MTVDNIVLIGAEEWVIDDKGYQVAVDKRTTVLADIRSVSGSEFYQAATVGSRPEVKADVFYLDYNGERKVEYGGKLFKVVRTYQGNTDRVELTLEQEVGG